MTVAGRDFPAKSAGSVSATFGENGPTQTARVRTDRFGSFAENFTVPSGFSGTVEATASVAGATANASLTSPAGPPSASPTPTPTASATTSPPASNSSFGVDESYTPTYDVLVPVGGLNQAVIDAHPAGTRFALAAGTHRISAGLAPKGGQQFLGFPGAVINGSRTLDGWVQDGSRWYVSGQTQRLPRADSGSFSTCRPDRPMCNHTEDVFFDDRLLQQVPQLSELAPGRYFFDYANSWIYLADNPAGHKVETTIATRAFKRDGVTGVVVKNLVVEKFGTPIQAAAIDGVGWTIENCEIRLNHGSGAVVSGGVVRGNSFNRNGQAGAGGTGNGQVFEHNEVAYNNVQGVNPYWAGHGVKWSNATNVTIRDNWVHHNLSTGLATDINNYNVLYEQNIVEDNEGGGISHEISYDAVIRNNIVRRNGIGGWTRWFTERLGIAVSNSPNVEIYGNTLEDNKGGGVLAVQNRRLGTAQYPDPDGNVPSRGAWMMQNLNVHDNATRLIGTGDFGSNHVGFDIHPDVPDRQSYVTSRNNRFDRNKYSVPAAGASARWFFYPDSGTGHAPRSWSQWQATGRDTAGEFSAQ